MTIERIEAGARMSMAVVHNATVYLAGQVAHAKAGGSIAEQTADVLASVDEILAKAGTDKTKILSATIYLVDIAHFAEMNAVWDAWLAPGCAPARATVQATLAGPQFGVEISVIAAL